MIKNILTIQSNKLLEDLEKNKVYRCSNTREYSGKYRKIQEALSLGEHYPIWLYRPSSIEYVSKGRLFRNERFISAYDMFNGFMYEMLFHISIGPLDIETFETFFKNNSVYEFSIDTEEIYDDTLEGYGVCGVTKKLENKNLVGMYKVSYTGECAGTFPVIRLTPHVIRNDSCLSKEEFSVLTINLMERQKDRIKSFLETNKAIVEKEYERQNKWFNKE